VTTTVHDPSAPVRPPLHGPRVTGPVPGPLGTAYLARQAARESNARTYPRRLPVAVARAEGSYVADVDGNVYLDFLTGAGALPLGHSHPEVTAAVSAQLDQFVHGLDLPTPAKDEFTDQVLGLLPEPLRDRMRVHFCGPTGANAIEAAIKLTTSFTGRGGVVSFQGGFHGSTLAAMSVTGLVSQKQPVPATMPGVSFFPYSSCTRCPLGLRRDSCEVNCAGYLERTLADPNGGVSLPGAAVMEMVQGEGGAIPAVPEFAHRVRDLTRRLDIPLIVDEIQTGCGRTGTWFAFEQYGIEPDVVVLSKAFGGIGLPVAVMLYHERFDTWQPGAHIGTFRGNQLAFAAGVAAIRIMRRDGVLDNVRRRGAQLADLLAPLAGLSPWVADVRGTGLMWGVELADPVTGEPAAGPAAEIQRRALQRGLIIEVGGRSDAVLRLLPALNCTSEQIALGVSILVETVDEVLNGRSGAAVPADRPPPPWHRLRPAAKPRTEADPTTPRSSP
jgi:diaminobutyrate-2-oxoglutarate transaminase